MSKELPRESRSFMWLEDFRRDVAYGVRTLLRTPGFTLVAVLTLALGISAVTVIYSVLRNVALDPFPYSRSDRLVNVVLRDGSGRIIRGPYFRSEEFLDYQEQTTAFEDVVGTSQFSAHWMSDGGAERLALNWMTPNGFDFLGVPPLIGRVFDYRDVAPGAPPVAVMNHRAWVTRFGADPGVIGRTLVLDGQPYTVIGVMPPRFEWNIADLWLPAAMQRSDDPQTPRGMRAFQAHLRPGVTAAEAEAQLNVVGARRAAERPNDYPPGFRFGIIPVVDWVVREFRGTLYALFGAVSLLLVIACCNVANMLLARATIREREITIRAAIGASRGRIVRQLLVESAVLACGGLAAGCLMAYGGIVALAGYMPRQGVPWETQIRLDRPVLLFALAAAAVATIGFGLFPALQSARRDVALGANATARSTGSRRQTRMRAGLVVAQVALSMVLLLGAGLLMRTFIKLARADLGLDPKNVLVAGIAFPPREQMSPEAQLQFYRAAVERIRSMPGVSAVALTSATPPFGGYSSPLEIPGSAVPPQSAALVTFASEQLLETVGTPVLQGRGLSALEVEKQTPRGSGQRNTREEVLRRSRARTFRAAVGLLDAAGARCRSHFRRRRCRSRRQQSRPARAADAAGLRAVHVPLPRAHARGAHGRRAGAARRRPQAGVSVARFPRRPRRADPTRNGARPCALCAPAFQPAGVGHLRLHRRRCSWRWASTACSPTPSHSRRAKSRSVSRSAAIGVTWCGWC